MSALLRLVTKSDRDNHNQPENFLPLLIIPGIMSSGMQIRNSAVHDKHIGERVWLNPIALGVGKIHMGKSFKIRRRGDTNAKPKQGNSPRRRKNATAIEIATQPILNCTDDSSETDTESSEADEEQPVLDCKSAWLQHMSLNSDMCSERAGNEIRPIPGLDGVDFLADIANITIGASYVFGPIIKLLQSIGYVKGRNIDACPYDWRIPPCVLEARDGYFTKTMKRIERMSVENDHKPVVLLCHSMGGKTGHYLLNFAMHTLGAVSGREWIDRYVHTYMPLAAAHIGAPSTVASTFTATLNPILDPLLSHKERLLFCRSMGSGMWLMPTTLPSIERNAPPAILCKNEGKLTIEILTTTEHPLGDVRTLVTNQYGTRDVGPFQIKVSYGCKKTDGCHTKQRSGVARPVDVDDWNSIPKNKFKTEKSQFPAPQYFELPCSKFIFPTPASLLDNNTIANTISSRLKPIRFSLYEHGDIRPCDLEPANNLVKGLRIIISRDHQTRLLWNLTAKKAGKYKINLGMSSPIENIDVKKLVQAGDKGLTLTVPIVARTDLTFLGMMPKSKHRSIDMKVNIKWEAPPSNAHDDPTNPIAAIPGVTPSHQFEPLSSSSSLFAPIPEIRSTKANDEMSDYVPLSGQAMLRAEGLEDSFVALARDKYCPRRDHVGPRHQSSSDRPPVKRIYAIYGINLDTEVSKVCKRVPSYHEDETPYEKQTRARFEVDVETRLGRDRGLGQTSSGHKLENGTLYEHAGTPQIDILTGEIVHRSGDGSVPYYCLQQTQVWARELQNDPRAMVKGDKIRIKELDGAEHRAVLSDERFHTLLVEYLTGQTSM